MPRDHARDHDRSKSKSKHHSGDSSNSSNPPGYPKAWSTWSKWTWSDEDKKYSRYRASEISKDRYEYEYEYEAQQATPFSASGTDSSSLAPIPESASRFPSSMPLSQPAGTNPISSLTRDMAGYSLGTGSQTSVQSAPPSQGYLTTKNPSTTEEDFDPNYRVHKQNEFKFGRVFKVLWAEPYGSGGTENSYREGAFGQKFHEKVRRFVIIQPKEGHCLCLPIMVYGGQGTNKHGVHARDHAVIHSTSRPVYLSGEENKMTKTPIKVNAYSSRHKLDKASRINFVKVYTVEYSVKVWFTGEVDSGSEWSLRASYEEEHQMFQDNSNWAYPSHAQNMPMTNTTSYQTGTSPAGYAPSTSVSCESSYSTQNYPSGNLAWPAASQSYQYGGSSVAATSQDQIQTYPYAIDPIPLRGGQAPELDTYSNYTDEDSVRETETGDLHSPSAAATKQTPYDEPNQLNTTPQSSHAELEKPRSTNTEALPRTLAKAVDSLDGKAIDLPNNLQVEESESSNVGSMRELVFSRADISRVPSPASSVVSLAFSYNSFPSQSSMTSAGDYSEALRDRFIRLLHEDEELQLFYKDALQKVDLDRFEKNFRRCLDQMSAHLRMEASSREEQQTARFIRSSSSSTAKIIRHKIQAMYDSVDIDGDRISEGEEEDEDVPSDGDEIDDPLEHLEAFVLSSASFALLKESLRLFIHPDPRLLALSRAWPITQPRSSRATLSYDVEWEIFEFLHSQFPKGQKLGDVQTVTGDAVNAQALSCSDYISTTWNETGTKLLEGFERLLAKTEGDSPDKTVYVQASQAKIELRLKSERVPAIAAPSPDQQERSGSSLKIMACITVGASHAIHAEILSALSWLCAAIRHSPYPEVVFSSTTIETSKASAESRTIKVRLDKLQHLQAGTSCWHSLFPHSVIAKGFPIKRRRQGEGLEISLPDMALLSQSLTAVEFNGGLVFEGLRTLLIPMQELEDDDAIQWHFESKARQKSRGSTSVGNILSRTGILQWHREPQLHRLIHRRCFLGWVEKATVAMGTVDYPITNIRPSRIPESPNTRHVTSYAITLGTSGLGFATAEAEMARKRVAVPSRLTLAIDKDIYETFADDSDANILVYDAGRKTAWCLPQPSVVLYSLRAILKRRKFSLFEGNREVNLPYASPDSDGADAALTILKDSLKCRVRKHGSGNDVIEEPLSKTIRQVWQLFNTVRTGLESAALEFSKVGEGPPKTLRGVEFADFLHMSDLMPIKQVVVDQPWSHLTVDPATRVPVLICKGLGQPIVPESLDDLCTSWKTVPSGMNYLVLLGRAVQGFLEQNDDDEEGSYLAEKVQWMQEKLLIRNHATGHTKIFHMQRLRSVSTGVVSKQIRRRVEPYIDSCFVFSSHKSATRCSKPLGNNFGMESKKNPPTAPVLPPDTQVPDLPELSSQTSASTAKSFDLNSPKSESISSHESDDMGNQQEEVLVDLPNREDASPQKELHLCHRTLRRRHSRQDLRSPRRAYRE